MKGDHTERLFLSLGMPQGIDTVKHEGYFMHEWQEAFGSRTVDVVQNRAKKVALSMIAREHILTQQGVLDEIGKPLKLTPVRKGVEASLRQVARDIQDNMPVDFKESLKEPQYDEDKGILHIIHEDFEIGITLFKLETLDKEPWVAAILLSRLADKAEIEEDLGENVQIFINQLNQACVGQATHIVSNGMVVRMAGAAQKFGPETHRWTEMIATMLLEIAAREELESGEQGPVGRYLEVLNIEAAGKIEPYTIEEIQWAALEYKNSLPRELARTVIIDELEKGVAVVVPFRAKNQVYALRTAFVVGEVANLPGGLSIMSRFYENMGLQEAYDWAKSFNGDDSKIGVDDDEEYWPQTTPWLYGSWQVWQMEQSENLLVYLGGISTRLRPYAATSDIIKGTVHEIWSSSNRYRLHQDFKEAIGGVDGTVQ
jgi:hypothetical protein